MTPEALGLVCVCFCFCFVAPCALELLLLATTLQTGCGIIRKGCSPRLPRNGGGGRDGKQARNPNGSQMSRRRGPSYLGVDIKRGPGPPVSSGASCGHPGMFSSSTSGTCVSNKTSSLNSLPAHGESQKHSRPVSATLEGKKLEWDGFEVPSRDFGIGADLAGLLSAFKRSS